MRAYQKCLLLFADAVAVLRCIVHILQLVSFSGRKSGLYAVPYYHAGGFWDYEVFWAFAFWSALWNGEIQAVETFLRFRLSLVRAAGALDASDGMVLRCIERAVSGTGGCFPWVLLQCCGCPVAPAGKQKRMALQNGITH